MELNKHLAWEMSFFVKCAHDEHQNKHAFNKGLDYFHKFCDILKIKVQKMINSWHKKMLPLFIEEFESHKGQNICYICRK